VQSTTKNKFRKIKQLHKILFVKKKNTAHAAQRWILSGEVSGKMNRVCCGAVKIFMGNKSSPLCTFLQNWWDLR